jgi:hypothetical protein
MFAIYHVVMIRMLQRLDRDHFLFPKILIDFKTMLEVANFLERRYRITHFHVEDFDLGSFGPRFSSIARWCLLLKGDLPFGHHDF